MRSKEGERKGRKKQRGGERTHKALIGKKGRGERREECRGGGAKRREME